MPRFDRGRVAVQGLGFVGAAMAIAVSSAVDEVGEPRFDVTGVDLDNGAGNERIGAINEGRFPFETSDESLTDALSSSIGRNLRAGTSPEAYATADVIVVDVPLDIDWRSDEPSLQLTGFERAIRTIGSLVRPGALVLVETTVPPGTTEKIVVPVLADELQRRGLDPDSVLVAHSYERVMPGSNYFGSIVNYWRVFAGTTDAAAAAAEQFLSTIINVEQYPLTRLRNTTSSETAKVLENTFRATTIALMEEWSRFAELAGVDLFEVVDAIRMRPTHSNMRSPGFGVGGYCLTKDPLFAKLAARQFWDTPMDFPFSTAAVRTNDHAPITTLGRLRELLGGSLEHRRILLLGISYRQDVGDTRYSPSETFTRAAIEAGATVIAHDPLVEHWDELEWPVPSAVPSPADFDAVVFAVPHLEYQQLRIADWLGGNRPVILDAFDVLSAPQRSEATRLGCVVASVGRSDAPGAVDAAGAFPADLPAAIDDPRSNQ